SGIDCSRLLRGVILSFFFQAEDGIRVFHVTGVQTCALPISGGPERFRRPGWTVHAGGHCHQDGPVAGCPPRARRPENRAGREERAVIPRRYRFSVRHPESFELTYKLIEETQ